MRPVCHGPAMGNDCLVVGRKRFHLQLIMGIRMGPWMGLNSIQPFRKDDQIGSFLERIVPNQTAKPTRVHHRSRYGFSRDRIAEWLLPHNIQPADIVHKVKRPPNSFVFIVSHKLCCVRQTQDFIFIVFSITYAAVWEGVEYIRWMMVQNMVIYDIIINSTTREFYF